MDDRRQPPDRQRSAVGYVRRSTDKQEQSLDDQAEAIRRYAAAHRLHLVRFYTDDAVSGTRSTTRCAFQALIADAQTPTCDFGRVLVYDVKRFGRVDNDEAGHYRWLLRRRGIQVVYIADGFIGGSIDDLIRPVKQWQAREEARDLSRVTLRGMLSKINRDLKGGFWLGGFPPWGYDLRYVTGEGVFRCVVRYMPDATKQLLDDRGNGIAHLRRREPHTVSKTDRCALVLSAPERVATIRLVFSLRVHDRWGAKRIAHRLNADGVPTGRGPL